MRVDFMEKKRILFMFFSKSKEDIYDESLEKIKKKKQARTFYKTHNRRKEQTQIKRKNFHL